MTLNILHKIMLERDSKISPTVIESRPYFSVAKSECTQYGFQPWQARDGLMYQIHPPTGENGLYGLRPDKPRMSKTGKPVKYEHPFNLPPRIDIPIDTHPFIPDPAIPCVVTEGVKKIDSILSNLPGEFLLLDLCNGVYGWLQNKQVIPDLNKITWGNRHCFLVFDNDVSTKPAVRYALTWLSEELNKRHASTSVVYLPENKGKKLGIDDYFSQNGSATELLEWMRLSQIDIPQLIDELSQVQNSKQHFEMLTRLVWRLADLDSPLEVRTYANLVKSKKILGVTELLDLVRERQKQLEQQAPGDDELRDFYIEKSPPTLYGLGEWRRYSNGVWPAVSASLIKQEIEETIESYKSIGISPDARLLSSVATLAEYKLTKPDEVWNAESDYLACKNGVLHLPTRILHPHNPELYLTSGVDYDYDENAQAPGWESFLYDLSLSMGKDVIDFLQEFSGYCLTRDCSHEIALWLYGVPGGGKSTFIEGVEKTLGNSHAGRLSLAQIEKSRFGLSGIVGKTLMVSTENPSDYLSQTWVLNAIVSGEKIPIEKKYQDGYDVIPHCKLLFAMNELPRVSDPNNGLFRRVKIVEFPVIPEEKRDPTLKEQIKLEGAGILVWMLDGLKRLQKRGKFEIPQVVKDATEHYKDNNDSSKQFLSSCIYIDTKKETVNGQAPKYKMTATELYTAYSEWCKTSGHSAKSMTRMAEEWKRLGLENYSPGNVSTYKWIIAKNNLGAP